mgnify:CR=1 FL=1
MLLAEHANTAFETKKPALGAGFLDTTNCSLGEMCRDELGHLEHVDDSFAAKDLLKIVVSVDITLVLRVLEVMLLDVDPERLEDL